MFLASNIIAALLLFMEAQLAWTAFSGLTNLCDAPEPVFPCAVAPLFNENFLNIPVVGQICVFYPMLNVATVTVQVIIMRENVMMIVPIKKWIRESDRCLFLLEVSTLHDRSLQ